MTTYIVKIEEQIIPVPPEIGQDDDKVRQALAPFYPGAAEAMITRTEKDDEITVNVVKRAGSKGSHPLAHLKECPGGQNPAIDLYQATQKHSHEAIDPAELLILDALIEAAIEAGQAQAGAVERAKKRLLASQPQPAPLVPLGF